MNLQELSSIAVAMVAGNKGLLAADESTSTIKRRFDSIKVESTEDSRRDYREGLFRTPGIGDFISGGVLKFDQSGGPALNTDGGGLSSNHPGMRGIFLLLESARQLRGESTSQAANAKLAVAHGNGGLLGATHTGGTVILASD